MQTMMRLVIAYASKTENARAGSASWFAGLQVAAAANIQRLSESNWQVPVVGS
jgi:hypothetical protein